MGLADLLRSPDQLTARLRVRAPDPKRLQAAVRNIRSGSIAKTRSTEETAALQARLRQMEPSRPPLAKGDLVAGCHAYLLPPDPPSISPVGRWLRELVQSRHQKRAMLELVAAYLDRFDADDQALIDLAAWLDAHRTIGPWRPNSPWPDRARSFALFQPNEAPARLAAHVLAHPMEPNRALEEAGLDRAKATGNLAEAAFRAACGQVSRLKGLPAQPGQARLLDWDRASNGGQVFPRSWPHLLDGCLLPWEREEPATDHKQRLIADLTAFAGGDPRAKPGSWRSVEKRDSMKVLMRWLTRASVMQFLDIVDESLRDPDARRMWAYRRAFWSSYLLGDPAKGELAIEGAWVAFQSNGAGRAERAARGRADFSGFGRHHLKTADHSALIVLIGDYVVVDWSHSGKYNVWKRSDRHAPKLYLFEYAGAAANLDEAPLRDSHVGAANFTWQKRLAEIIEGRPFYYEKPSWRPHVRP